MPPTTAPIRTPRVVEPVFLPITPPTAPPAAAPITAPFWVVLIEAQPNEPISSRHRATRTAGSRSDFMGPPWSESPSGPAIRGGPGRHARLDGSAAATPPARGRDGDRIRAATNCGPMAWRQGVRLASSTVPTSPAPSSALLQLLER